MKQQPTALRMTDPGIRDLFSEDRIWQSWLDVEAALAQAQADLDVIPSERGGRDYPQGALGTAG